jgi:cell division septum initiation protein DivIVA
MVTSQPKFNLICICAWEDDMPDLDENLLVILQKAKEDEIERRIYTKIRQDLTHLKFLGLFGAVVIALLAVFHSQLLTFVIANYGEGLRTTIQNDVKSQTEMLTSSEHRVRAVSDAMVAQSQSYLDDIIKRQAEVARTRGDLNAQLSQLEEEIKKIDLAKAKITQAQSDAQVAINQLKTSEPRIAALIANQDTIIAALNSRGIALDKVTNIVVNSIQPVAAEPQGTVYFQFAGFDRPVAKKISDKIREAGWTIPGEERTLAAENVNEVRFNAQDRGRADLLTRDANTALQALNFPITLAPKQTDSVKPGILEIWIYQR